jgi:hypothetical protein
MLKGSSDVLAGGVIPGAIAARMLWIELSGEPMLPIVDVRQPP